MRILIVEDERHLAEALSQILTEQHYQTTWSMTAPTDWTMPSPGNMTP